MPPLRNDGQATPRVLCSRCLSGDETITVRKLAETDSQVQALRRYVGNACVAIASSLDTLPDAAPGAMRDRWLRTLRQATRV
jgi:hypothetical protein